MKHAVIYDGETGKKRCSLNPHKKKIWEIPVGISGEAKVVITHNGRDSYSVSPNPSYKMKVHGHTRGHESSDPLEKRSRPLQHRDRIEVEEQGVLDFRETTALGEILELPLRLAASLLA